jgi:hypothetical protein
LLVVTIGAVEAPTSSGMKWKESQQYLNDAVGDGGKVSDALREKS